MNMTIRAAYNNCKLEEWLEYGDKRYIDFSERGLRGIDGDVAAEIRKALLASEGDAQVLMSGFRGCGKTTELKRLAHRLEEDGFWVVFIDTEDYLNLRMPATISDLWISIAAGFDSFLAQEAAVDQAFRRFWDRLRAFMNREVDISDVKFSIPEAAEFQVSLKDNPDFRTVLNQALEAKRPKLVSECRDFVDEGIALLHKRRPEAKGTVIIVDSFEKLQGDARTAEDVRISAETLFTRDWRLLKAPCNIVYTVPPWLAFTETAPDCDLGRTRLLPMCKIAEKSGGPCENGIQALFDMLNERMDLDAVFGNREAIRPLVEMSGGYPRDLLRMIREVLLRNIEVDTLPLSPEKSRADVARIIQIYINLYDTGLDGEDIELLRGIAESKMITGWSREEKFRLADLFEHHFVLSFQNGDPWLDLHPLLRETPSMQAELKKKQGEKA